MFQVFSSFFAGLTDLLSSEFIVFLFVFPMVLALFLSVVNLIVRRV